MDLDTAASPTSRSARSLAAAIILGMMAITGILATASYYVEDENTERLLGASVSALDYQTDRSFRAIDDLLSDAAGHIDPAHWPDAKLVSWFQGRLSAFPEIHNVILIRPDGQALTAGLTAAGQIGNPINVFDREYFKYHLAHKEDRSIHIGTPVFSRIDGHFGIPVSRAAFDAKGEMAGVVRALVEPQFLTQSLSMVRVSDSGVNMLVRSDGVMIARAPENERSAQKSFALEPRFRDVVLRSREGVGRFVSEDDGTPQILAYRQLERYPLIVVAGMTRAEAFADWRTQIFWGVALLVGLSVALFLVAARSDRRDQQRALLAATAHQAKMLVLQTQQQFVDAIETISDGFALYDREDRLVMSNVQYRTMFAGAEDVIQPGNRFADIVEVVGERGIYGFKGLALKSFLTARLAEHNNPTGRALLHQIKGGRWIVSKEFRTRDGGVVATRTDVTELHRREEEVEELKKRYELILGSAGDGIIGIDASETITFANHAACHMLGVSEAALDGNNYRKALCGTVDTGVLPTFPLDGETGVAGEGPFCGPAKSSFIAEFMLAPMREEDEFEGAVLVFRDISLRKQYEVNLADHQRELERQVAERTRTLSAEIDQRSRTEEALRKSQGRLMGIASTLIEGVLLVDLNGHILFANNSAHRLLNREGRPLPGTDLDEVMLVLRDGEGVPFSLSPFQQAVEDGKTVIENDAQFVTAEKCRLSVGFAVAPLEEEGKRRGVVISFRSIEILKAAQREAMQASRLASVGQLAAGIAHEINTPIQYVGDNLRFIGDAFGSLTEAISGLKGLLEETGFSVQAKQFCDDKDIDYLLEELPLATSQSLQGIDHVAHIVRSMKEFSHPGTTHKVTTDLNHAIESTITVSRNEWRQWAEVETSLAPDLPAVLCFPAEVNQVLLNLIVNAAHAIESGKTEGLGVIRVSTRQDGDSVEIRVADSGPGISEAIRDKIFDPFFTTKGVGKGTGQGLSICHDVIVKKHGGKIFFDDSPGGGAVFVVRLPINELSQANGGVPGELAAS